MTQNPKWKLTGRDRETGEPKRATVQAATEDDAVKKAGFIVESVTRVKETELSEPVVVPVAGGSVPAYNGLLLASSVLRILAVLSGIALVLSLLLSFLNDESVGVFAARILGLITGGLGVVFLWGASEVFVALRDLAQNSFKRA